MRKPKRIPFIVIQVIAFVAFAFVGYQITNAIRDRKKSVDTTVNPVVVKPVIVTDSLPSVEKTKARMDKAIAKRRLQSLADLHKKVVSNIEDMSRYGSNQALVNTEFIDKAIVDQEIQALKNKGYEVYYHTESKTYYEFIIIRW